MMALILSLCVLLVYGAWICMYPKPVLRLLRKWGRRIDRSKQTDRLQEVNFMLRAQNVELQRQIDNLIGAAPPVIVDPPGNGRRHEQAPVIVAAPRRRRR